MSRSEPSDREHRCEICGESFPSAEALERHIHEIGLVE